jgi:hypothetical protein
MAVTTPKTTPRKPTGRTTAKKAAPKITPIKPTSAGEELADAARAPNEPVMVRVDRETAEVAQAVLKALPAVYGVLADAAWLLTTQNVDKELWLYRRQAWVKEFGQRWSQLPDLTPLSAALGVALTPSEPIQS